MSGGKSRQRWLVLIYVWLGKTKRMVWYQLLTRCRAVKETSNLDCILKSLAIYVTPLLELLWVVPCDLEWRVASKCTTPMV